MIYQKVSIDGVDITGAVSGWVAPEPVYLAGSSPAVIETAKLKIILPLLLRDYGMSFETLRDCTEVIVKLYCDTAWVERSYRVMSTALESGLISDDTAELELSSTRSALLDGLLPAAYRLALQGCYLPLAWPPGVQGSLTRNLGLTGQRVNTSGVALREWPGELVVGLESRARRMNWALAPMGTGIAAGDYDGLFDGKLDLTLQGAGLRLGAKLSALNGLQVLLLSTVGGVLYAYAAPGFERFDYPADYMDVAPGGVYRLPGAVGGDLQRLGNWGLPREWYATREYRSRAVFIGREPLTGGGYYLLHAQAIGSVVPTADRSTYDGYIAQESDGIVPPGSEWLSYTTAEEWRELRYAGLMPFDFMEFTDVPGWHFKRGYSKTPTVEGWSGNLFVPVTSRISIAFSDPPGSVGIGDYSNGMLTPEIHIFKRHGARHWATYPASSNGGPGLYDPAGLDLGACPQVVEPGWYAIGACGPEIKYASSYNPLDQDRATLAKSNNRVRAFTVTVEPIETPSMIGRTVAAGAELVAIGATVSSGDLSGQAENDWNYKRLSVEWRNAAGAKTAQVALPPGALGARLAYDGTDVWSAYTYSGRPEYSLWTYAQGVQPEGNILALTRYNAAREQYLVATTIPWTANSHQAHDLKEEMFDYAVDGIKWQGGDLYLAVRKRRRKLEKLILPLRKCAACWDTPPDIPPGVWGIGYATRANMGYIEVGGDATERLKAGDSIRLYVPRWTRGGECWGDDTPGGYEQRMIAYPALQRCVNVSYDNDTRITTLILDPGPDRSHVYISGKIGMQVHCTGYWEQGASSDVIDDSAPADAEVWIDRGWGPWAAELWKIPARAFSWWNLRNAVEVIDAATEEHQHTVRPRYDSGSWTATLEAEPIGEVEVAGGIRASVIDMETEPGVSFQADPGEVEVRYTGTSRSPYAWAGDYIIHQGDVYRLSGGSLVPVYPGPSGETVPVGDGVVGGDGHTYLPVALDTGARMLVIGTNLLPGIGLRPQGSNVRTLQDWLKLPAAFGCRQGPGAWAMTTLPANAVEVSTADVLDWWYDSDYSATRQLSIKYGDDRYYPSLGAVSTEGEPESYDASSVICCAPDAAHVYSWRAMIGAPVLGRFFVQHRITMSTLNLINHAGMLHRYGFERPRLGIMLGMTTDLDSAIMTVEYADIGGLGAGRI